MALAAARASVNNPSGRCGANSRNASARDSSSVMALAAARASVNVWLRCGSGRCGANPRNAHARNWSSVMALAAARASVNSPSGRCRADPRNAHARNWSSVMALAAARASVNNPSGRCGADPPQRLSPELVVGDGAGRGEGVGQQPLGQVRRRPRATPQPGTGRR